MPPSNFDLAVLQAVETLPPMALVGVLRQPEATASRIGTAGKSRPKPAPLRTSDSAFARLTGLSFRSQFLYRISSMLCDSETIGRSRADGPAVAHASCR